MAASTSSASSFETSRAGETPDTSTTASTASTEAVDKPVDDSGKLRLFLGILRKFIGITDLAAVRFSLPAQLLEPTPNLEYWNYLDRPEMFTAIGDSDDDFERMLEVLRFWFTKDLKYVKGKPCKPYNSALGEFFRCNWEVTEAAPPISTLRPSTAQGSASSSVKSFRLSTPPVPGTPTPAYSKLEKPILVSYLTEQTSHHPPVSAFYVDCPEKGLSARGFDQIAAKFTGTSIKVSPGEHNLGIFIDLHKRSEAYQLTHPTAHLGGLLRGSLSVTVGDKCYVTCAKTKIKTILHYVEEGWLGKTQNRVDGMIFKYDPEDDAIVNIKDVPEKDILARVFGNWKERLSFTMGAKTTDPPITLLDLTPLFLSPKVLPPPSSQLPNESLRFWGGVTEAIKSKQFGRATVIKQEIEEAQREKAREREKAASAEGGDLTYRPRFFKGATEANGQPELTDAGREVLGDLQNSKWELEEGEGKMA